MQQSMLDRIVQNFNDPGDIWKKNVVFSYLFSVVAILIMPSPLNHFVTIDPIIYQSYIHDYKYMVDVFGYTYYAIRVAWLVPATVFQHLFGDQAGYLLVRVAFLGAGASAMAILVDRLVRRPFGLYAAAWVAFSPAFLRELGQDYGDASAFFYAMLAMACVLTRREDSKVQHLFGGIFLGLAFNTYPVAASAAIMTAPAWFFLRRGNSLQSNLLCAACTAGGFLLIYLLIAGYLWSVFTAAGQQFELIPLSTMKSLSSGGAVIWQVSLKEIFLVHGDWSRAYPVFVLTAIGAFFTARMVGRKPSPGDRADVEAKEITDTLVVSAILCAMAILLYLVLHFKLQSGAIVWPWMYDFVLPGCALGAIGLTCAMTPPRSHRWMVLMGVVTLLAPYLLGILNRGLPYTPPMTGLAAGVAMPLLVALAAYLPSAAMAAAAVLLAFPLVFYSTATFGSCGYPGEVNKGRWLPVRASYAGCMFRANGLPVERDLRAGTLAMMDEVKKVDPGSPPAMWYANNSGFADEVGSGFLWLYTRVASTADGDPGMPNLDAVARSQINKASTLVLVGASRAELQKAEKTLADAGYDLTLIGEHHAGGKRFSFDYAILRKNPLNQKLYTLGRHVNLVSAVAQNGVKLSFQPDGLHFRTPFKTWSYALSLPLTYDVDVDTAFIEIDLTVTSGMIGADILPQGKTEFAGPEVRARNYRGASQKTYVPVSLYDRPVLVLRNSALGTSSAVIHSVRLVQKKPAADGK